MIDQKKLKNEDRLSQLVTTAFIYIFVRWVYPLLATPVGSTKLLNVGFFKNG